MKKKYLSLTFVSVLTLFALFYLFHKDNNTLKEEQKINTHVLPEKPYEVSIHTKNIRQKAISEAKDTHLKLEDKEKLTIAMIEKFKKTRNIIMADPSLSLSQKKNYINKMQLSLFKDKKNIPALSNKDLEKQDLIKKEVKKFKSKVKELKSDASLTIKEKKIKMKQLVSEFIDRVDSI